MTDVKLRPFLKEILTNKEDSSVIDIKEKIPYITSQIQKLKCDVKSFADNDDNFSGSRDINNKFLKQVKNLNNEMSVLTTKVDGTKSGIDNSLQIISKLKSNLDEAEFALKLTTELVNINEAMKKHQQLGNDKKYLEAIQEITFARKICEAIPKEEQLDLIKVISDNITIQFHSLREKIFAAWSEVLIIDKNEENDTTHLKIKISKNTADLEQIIEALYYDKQLSYFNSLANILLNEVLIPIVNTQIEMCTMQESVYDVLEIKITNSSKMHFQDVCSNILSAFNYLSSKMNYKLTSNLHLLAYIGYRIRDDFCNNFIINCLADTVPSTRDGLEKYKEIAKEVESLHESLIKCNFLDKDCVAILEYIGDMDSLCMNKMCEKYKEKATIILKKDLHDMIEIKSDPNQSPENQNDFPKCSVSRSALEYLNHARLMLDQMVTCERICADQLLRTFKQLFEMYCVDILQYHKKLLETIPQQVALYHNNCMYIAHELEIYKEYYLNKISKEVFNGESIDYLVQVLQKTGTEAFTKFIKLQKKQVEDILNGSELALLGQVEKLNPNCEKSIRQCLRQLELLKTVWKKVLNYDLYNASIGDLLNHFIDYLIKLVLNVEDISAETSTLLVDVFNVVKNRGPNLFTEPKEINMYTGHWCKFNELILLLNSSLNDINDRWSDGKGPLAIEYSPDDIRKLIRSLFQNTDRRAAILTKIV